MPRTRSLAWTELKVGLVSITALGLAMMLIFTMGSAGGFFWQRYSLKILFDDVAGLKAGAPVRIAGVAVGSVSELQFAGDRVEVVIELAKEHQSRVTTGSRATLGSVSLLGEGAVDLTSSTEGTPIPDWGYVPTGRQASTFNEVAADAADGIQEATNLLRDIRGGRGTIGQFFTNDALYQDLNRLVGSAERVATRVSQGQGTLGRLTSDDALYRDLNASVSDLNAITARIRNGEGSLGKFLHDPGFADSLTATTRNIEGVTSKLDRGEGTAGRLLNETVLYDRLTTTVEQLERFTNTLNTGQGTLGQLLNDKQLYENMNQTVLELRDFLAEVKKDPKKYLNVKVSIF
ncbi:MAG TPA: MlaD family protein [Vicinamibacterales bacterium]|nr:MlaD family protein [Vicinamibacterales bacterium]